jgi:hypothetical protein
MLSVLCRNATKKNQLICVEASTIPRVFPRHYSTYLETCLLTPLLLKSIF